MKHILLILFFLSLSPATVNIERAIVRQGPGAFFPVVAELGRGAAVTILSEEDGWLNIEAGAVKGWISSRATTREGARPGGLTRPGAAPRQVDMTVSATGVSAAVRGFAKQFSTAMRVNEAEILGLEQLTFHVNRYQAMREDTYPRGRRGSALRRAHRLPPLDNGMLFYPIEEEGAGFAIAASLASRGLYREPAVEEYVNFIGHFVVEASHGYDLGYRFYIINDMSRESYAVPGGFIFVTKGLLMQMRDEAELAGVLAHEIAHITMRHGLREMANRRNVVAADAAFRELDGSVDRSREDKELADSINNELITYRDRMYSMRVQDYETSADAMASHYMARAGYSPQALLNLVTRLFDDIPADAPPYQANELTNRRNALLAELAKSQWRGDYTTQAARYQAIRNRIR